MAAIQGAITQGLINEVMRRWWGWDEPAELQLEMFHADLGATRGPLRAIDRQTTIYWDEADALFTPWWRDPDQLELFPSDGLEDVHASLTLRPGEWIA